MIHRLLRRQLKLLSLSEENPPTDAAQWKNFLERISKVYTDNDQDRYLVERSLQISSKEMQEHWQALDQEKMKTLHSAKFAALGEMAGSIAHEINNPIGLISILANQLEELITDNSLTPEILSGSLRQIDESAWKAAKIIKGLRGFSRDGSNDPLVTTRVKAILDDLKIFCTEKFKSHGVTLNFKAPDEQLSLDCREVEICQVLLNLLNNAFDAVLPADPKWIELSVGEIGDYIEFAVTNSGEKIAEENATKLFQPFFTTKEVGKGTGLGLSISRKIAENHQGTLVYDANFINTRFVLKIPKRHTGPGLTAE